jgi:dinuclear metal center YbgI/SA1388 family protein
MYKYEIIKKIENFAPLETQEEWDCSGWGVDVSGHNEISKIMLCLTVTGNIIKQAKEQNCDMIISHHPLFEVPFEWKDINIYCAHTNLDLAKGGTTDTLIKTLGLEAKEIDGFVRYVDIDTTVEDFAKLLRKISPNMRYVNNNDKRKLHRIAFCAGSGSEFIEEAFENGADAYVTGDLKFHTALDSPVVVFDIGHFESEIMVLGVFKNLVGSGVEIVFAKEKSPFIY